MSFLRRSIRETPCLTSRRTPPTLGDPRKKTRSTQLFQPLNDFHTRKYILSSFLNSLQKDVQRQFVGPGTYKPEDCINIVQKVNAKRRNVSAMVFNM